MAELTEAALRGRDELYGPLEQAARALLARYDPTALVVIRDFRRSPARIAGR